MEYENTKSVRILIVNEIKKVENFENTRQCDKREGKKYVLRTVLSFLNSGEFAGSCEEIKTELEKFKVNRNLSQSSGAFREGAYLMLAKISGFLVLSFEEI